MNRFTIEDLWTYWNDVNIFSMVYIYKLENDSKDLIYSGELNDMPLNLFSAQIAGFWTDEHRNVTIAII